MCVKRTEKPFLTPGLHSPSQRPHAAMPGSLTVAYGRCYCSCLRRISILLWRRSCDRAQREYIVEAELQEVHLCSRSSTLSRRRDGSCNDDICECCCGCQHIQADVNGVNHATDDVCQRRRFINFYIVFDWFNSRSRRQKRVRVHR